MQVKGAKKQILIFIDTNLLWNDQNDFNIFSTSFLTQLIQFRDFFNNEVQSTEIKIIFPNTVIRERYKQKLDTLLLSIKGISESLKKLTKMKIFNNDSAISDLEQLTTNLHHIIENEGTNFLLENSIISCPDCPDIYFENIVQKAYNKEKPFDNKKADGFKDSLIWFSVIDYVRKQKLKEDDLIIFFTINKRDFESEAMLGEFFNFTQKNLLIFGFDKTYKIHESSENQEFLKYLLKEAQEIKITGIRIGYNESVTRINIENIFADPFPSNLLKLIDTHDIRKNDCIDKLKARVITLLKSLNFHVISDRISIEARKLPAICDITVFLDYHTNGQFYDINFVKIEFDDGEEVERYPENYNVMIFDEYIINYETPDFDYFWINQEMNKNVAEIIEELSARKVDPDSIRYTVLD
jgi:hypothetical protein